MRDTFAGGKRLAYGARALTEGGYQSVPKLAFPGGALIGCEAGFMNVPRIKGSHNAMLSGMLAAEAAAAALVGGPRARRTRRLRRRLARLARSARTCGRCATPSRCGRSSALSSASRSAVSTCGRNTLGFSLFGTLKHGKPDYATLKPAAECTPIAYPKPDGKLTFDRLSSVFLSNTNHEEDQPVHLRVEDLSLQKSSEHDVFAGPSARYCPAGVYEWVEEGGQPQIRDQRAELRPLQNLRHQGPESEHHLGSAGRRRRTELSEYVIGGRRFRPRCCHIGAFNLISERRGPPFLRGRRKKAILGPTSAVRAKSAVIRPIGASPVTSSSLARCVLGTALAVFLVGGADRACPPRRRPRWIFPG